MSNSLKLGGRRLIGGLDRRLSGGLGLAAMAVVALSLYPASPAALEAEEVATTAAAAEPAVDSKTKTDTTESRNGKSPKPGKGPLPTYTPEREAAALTFVSAHHPELAPLLAHLKKSRPQEYQKAIRKLFNDSERLAHSREMKPGRYELELQEWKLSSRIELLVARLTMDRTPSLEAELRKALAEQLDVRRALLVQERERATQRLESLDKEIAELDENREKRLDEKFEKAVNSTGKKK
jgi:hypothetical protein